MLRASWDRGPHNYKVSPHLRKKIAELNPRLGGSRLGIRQGAEYESSGLINSRRCPLQSDSVVASSPGFAFGVIRNKWKRKGRKDRKKERKKRKA